MANSSVAGWVAFFVLLAFVFAERGTILFNDEPKPDYCKASTDRHSAKEAAQAGARAEDDVSAQPKKQPGRQNADCVQWRSAIATEDQARYTRWGLWLIGLTLGAGTIAAVAAWRTVATMDDTARRQLRAYVSVEPGGIHPISAGPFVIGYVSLRNTGNLPAGKASWIINLDFSRDHKRKDFSPKEIDAEGSAVIFPRVAIFRATRRGETSVHQSSDDAPLFAYVWGAVDLH